MTKEHWLDLYDEHISVIVIAVRIIGHSDGDGAARLQIGIVSRRNHVVFARDAMKDSIVV
jgi:hypothetical protein